MEQVAELVAALPTPFWAALVLFGVQALIIADTGAGAPLFFPLFKPFMKGFKPTAAYQRLWSKYVI